MLQEFTKPEICLDQLFMLCYSLQPDRQRSVDCDDELELSECPDPCDPTIPSSSLQKFQNQKLEPHSKLSLLYLPLEIIIMILKFLPPSSLARFFCSCEHALSYATEFFSQRTLHFYGCIDATSTVTYIRMLMLALNSEFSDAQFLGLDKKWELVSTVADLACVTLPAVNLKAQLSSIGYPFASQELIAEIPGDTKEIEAHMMILQGKRYICGIRFQIGDARTLIGNKSNISVKINVAHIQIARIGFIVDLLGIRSLRFGDSEWSSGHPGSIRCWEGFNKRREATKIRIVRDGLKFRQVSWCRTDPPSFEESILMREEHAGFVCQEDFVQQNPHEETNLIRDFGSLLTEVVWLNEHLHGITMYCDSAFTGIVGVRLHTSMRSRQMGRSSAMAKFFPLHGPKEVITRIDVRLHSQVLQLAIMIRTNWNRQCLFGSALVPGTECTIKRLEPPPEHHIRGFYFRMGNPMRIVSFGTIYSAGSLGTPCSCMQPVLRMPSIITAYERESFSFFESCARLSRIQKVEFYDEKDRCTGLRIFYDCGSSEVLGRVQENHSRELILLNGDIIRQIWITYEDEQLKNIEFETEDIEHQGEEGELYDVAESAAIAWWYSETKDIIRIF